MHYGAAPWCSNRPTATWILKRVPTMAGSNSEDFRVQGSKCHLLSRAYSTLHTQDTAGFLSWSFQHRLCHDPLYRGMGTAIQALQVWSWTLRFSSLEMVVRELIDAAAAWDGFSGSQQDRGFRLAASEGPKDSGGGVA